MSKKSWPVLYSKLLFKMGQDLLYIQYSVFFMFIAYMLIKWQKYICSRLAILTPLVLHTLANIRVLELDGNPEYEALV